LSLANFSRGTKRLSASPTRQAALAVFPRGKEGHSPQPSQKMAREKDKNFIHSSNSETTTFQTRSRLIKTIENTVIEPRCRQVGIGKLTQRSKRAFPR
jgi:hypothetical protein